MTTPNTDDDLDIIEDEQSKMSSKIDSQITPKKQSVIAKKFMENLKDEDLLIIPSRKERTISSDFKIENDEDLLIIDMNDVDQFADNQKCLQSFDEMRNYTNDKRFEEWVYVETDRITFQIRDNLLLVSSVYDDDKNCCVIQ